MAAAAFAVSAIVGAVDAAEAYEGQGAKTVVDSDVSGRGAGRGTTRGATRVRGNERERATRGKGHGVMACERRGERDARGDRVRGRRERRREGRGREPGRGKTDEDRFDFDLARRTPSRRTNKRRRSENRPR